MTILLKIGTASAAPLRAGGWSEATLLRVGGGASTLTLSRPQSPLDDAPMAVGADILLTVDSGAGAVSKFVGRCRSLEWIGAGRVRCTCADAWYDLERITYQDTRRMRADPASLTSPLIDVVSSRVVLFQALDGSPVLPHDQIQAALTYAVGAGVAVAVTGTGLHTFTQVPLEEATDISVAEVIRRAVRWLPFAGLFLRYDSSSTILDVQAKAALSPVAVALDAGRVLSDEFSIRRRDDLVVPGVKIFFESAVIVETDEEVLTRAKYSVQSAGVTTAPGAVVAYVELAGQTAKDAPEPEPPGLAAAYFAALQEVVHGGSLALRGADCAWEIDLGMRLTLSAGRTEWSTMIAPIQSVTHELLLGRTAVDFGPSERVGLSVFADLAAFRRLKNRTNLPETRRTGESAITAVPPSVVAGAGNSSPSGGSSAGSYVDLEVCHPVRGTVRVLAAFTATPT